MSNQQTAPEQTATNQLRKLFSKLKVKDNELDVIASCFEQFIKVRHEDISDYPNLEDWINYLCESGYSPKQIVQIFEKAKDLPKYRKGQLAIGDLITHWKKETETQLGISWHEFSIALNQLLNSDKELIDKLSIETVGIPFMTAAERKISRNFIQLIRERTESELASCVMQRKFKAADWIDNAEHLNKIDKMILFEVILVMRAVIYECEHTTRQPKRILAKKLEELEQNFKGYYSDEKLTYNQELAGAATKALAIAKGYTQNKDQDIKDITETLLKYNLIQREF